MLWASLSVAAHLLPEPEAVLTEWLPEVASVGFRLLIQGGKSFMSLPVGCYLGRQRTGPGPVSGFTPGKRRADAALPGCYVLPYVLPSEFVAQCGLLLS